MVHVPKRVPALFYRTMAGGQPVRDWLRSLSSTDRREIGADIATVEFGWPIGMPTCRPLGQGLHELRTTLSSDKIARVFFCVHDGQMVLLHAFIKKSKTTPPGELEIARRRMREVVS